MKSSEAFDFSKLLDVSEIQNPFKFGQFVKLKNGSPRMTVIDIIDHDTIVCSWIDASRGLHEKAFEISHLVPYYTK